MAPPDQRPSTLNHRRPPAHCSVSLRHTPVEAAVRPSQARQRNSNDGSSYCLNRNGGSGKDNDADDWFVQSNNDGRGDIRAFADNDPPFYISGSSSSEPGEQQQQGLRQNLAGDSTKRTHQMNGVLQLGDDRNTKDLGSIINDLTIRNKRLRRRLQRYKKQYTSRDSFNDRKLFEVRVHRLGTEEKRELEEMLYNFVSSLPNRQEFTTQKSGCRCHRPNLKHYETASSQASLHVSDSAYASMSASELDSSTSSGYGSKHDQIMRPAGVGQQILHDDLNDSASLLLPPTPMGKRETYSSCIHQCSRGLTGATSSSDRIGSAIQKSNINNGSIIFYHNACFFADLSGDPVAQGNDVAPFYELSISEPFGKPRLYDDIPCKIFEERGPLEEAMELPEPMDLIDNPIPESMELAFPQPSSPRCSDEVLDSTDINLEISGIGGTYPADNFAINVQSRHARVEPTTALTLSFRNAAGIIRDRLDKILRAGNPQRTVRAAVGYHVANLQRIEYRPSALPSPLYLISSDEESISEDASTMGSLSTWPDLL